MNSPTTLLTSIQFMKSKLRSDKELLQDIKKDFHMISRNKENTDPQPSQPAPHSSEFHRQDPFDAKSAAALRKQHQREIRELKQAHQQQIEIKDAQHRKSIEEVRIRLESKIREQTDYIAMLEEQIGAPEPNEQPSFNQDQYDKIVNQLLQENTILIGKIQQLKKQISFYSERFRSNIVLKTNEVSEECSSRINSYSSNHSRGSLQARKSRSRLKFGKARPPSQQNISADEKEESGSGDERIEEDEAKMRTIRGFVSMDLPGKYLGRR